MGLSVSPAHILLGCQRHDHILAPSGRNSILVCADLLVSLFLIRILLEDVAEKATIQILTTTMKTFAAITAALLVGTSSAFMPQTLSTTRTSDIVTYGYVPAGFTPESYKKFKDAEAAKKKKAGLGKLGPRGFKSRSFQSFQEALERGETTHLMPVMNAEERVRKGELRREDIPVSF